jgi:hypothetical protein
MPSQHSGSVGSRLPFANNLTCSIAWEQLFTHPSGLSNIPRYAKITEVSGAVATEHHDVKNNLPV